MLVVGLNSAYSDSCMSDCVDPRWGEQIKAVERPVPDVQLEQIWLSSHHCWQDARLVLLAGDGIRVCWQEISVHLTDGLGSTDV